MKIGISSFVKQKSIESSAGFVLPSSLMILTVISIVAFSLQTLVFLQRQIARTTMEVAQYRWAVTGAFHHVVSDLIYEIESNNKADWDDGVSVNVNGLVVAVTVTDSASYLDINLSTESQISNHFRRRSINRKRADTLAGHIADWRDPDDLVRVNGAEQDAYRSAEAATRRPGNRKFITVSEVAQVLSVTEAEVKVIEADFTVHHGTAQMRFGSLIGEAPKAVKPGMSLRIVATCCSDTEEMYILKSVITLTGSQTRPYWVREWEMHALPASN